MDNIHITVPATPAIEKLVAALLEQEGVTVERSIPCSNDRNEQEYLTLQEGAKLARVNYFTFRRWVVEQGRIKAHRPSGAKQGKVMVKRSDVLELMNGSGVKKKPGRPGREVGVI